MRGKVVGIELHPQEPQIQGRESIAIDGCVVLLYMPKCIYVRRADSNDVFLPLREDFDVKGVLAIAPKSRSFKFNSFASCGISRRKSIMGYICRIPRL